MNNNIDLEVLYYNKKVDGLIFKFSEEFIDELTNVFYYDHGFNEKVAMDFIVLFCISLIEHGIDKLDTFIYDDVSTYYNEYYDDYGNTVEDIVNLLSRLLAEPIDKLLKDNKIKPIKTECNSHYYQDDSYVIDLFVKR